MVIAFYSYMYITNVIKFSDHSSAPSSQFQVADDRLPAVVG